MKTLMIIISVLAITTIVYGFDPKRSRDFYAIRRKCEEQYENNIKGLKEGNPSLVEAERNYQIFLCAVKKEGRVINKDGLFELQEAYDLAADLMSSEYNGKFFSRAEITSCHLSCIGQVKEDYLNYTPLETTVENTLRVIKCISILLNLIDIPKPDSDY